MLSEKTLKAFVATTNAARAKWFYQEQLGLKLVSEDNYALEFNVNGVPLRITPVATLYVQPFTVLGWNVEDISSVIRSLNEKNIYCERYNSLPQDAQGVWVAPGGSKVAWFKDPDGNILSLTQL
jgi:catechol 2,3-dioxygenase-like lactoylglutathione lyase family enzyme